MIGVDIGDEQGPFDGCIGFSQGAAMAALLCATCERAFRFAVFFGGFTPRSPDVAPLFAAESRSPALEHVATLHVYGAWTSV